MWRGFPRDVGGGNASGVHQSIDAESEGLLGSALFTPLSWHLKNLLGVYKCWASVWPRKRLV